MLAKRPADPLASYPQKRSRHSDASSETSTGPAAEVAGDFRDSLSDLSINDRYQISTLTIIAKENTEHALAISDVLLNHIRTVPPQRKLPALFVLDSIVKNVGTPYTIFLSRNLYKTFMDAYTLVDSNTRKQMESMLKTWKEPIPGSMEQKPVFAVDTTRNIENALIRARTVFVEQQKNQNFPGLQRPPSHALPSRPPILPDQQWRNPSVPAPPQFHAHQYPPPPQQQPYQQQYGAPPTNFQYGMQQNNDQHFQSPAPPYAQSQYQTPSLRSPVPPPGYQSQFPPPPPPGFQPQYQHQPVPSPQPNYQAQFPPPPPPQFSYQQSQPPYQPPPSTTPIQPPQPSSQQGHWSLTALLQATGTHQPPSQLQQNLQQPPSALQFPGLDALYQSQNKTATPTPQYNTPFAPPPPPNQAFATPPASRANLAGQTTAVEQQLNDVKLTSASIKSSRPGLLGRLYLGLANSQCTTCGRRFAIDTAPGQQRKTRHLDAHFRTNMRMTSAAEARGTGASRSWYIDEMEWIAYRERDDADADEEGPSRDNGASVGAMVGDDGVTSASSQEKGRGKGKVAERYITAPADAVLRKQVCPICQEEFKAEYHEGEQEWVFMDAIKVPQVGDDAKVYHASCLDEMAKDRGG